MHALLCESAMAFLHPQLCFCSNVVPPHPLSFPCLKSLPCVRDRDAILLGLLCILCPMVPITGLFFHVPTVLSDRAMYLPIVGLALLAGAGTANISVVECR